ncbi:MAG TPA: hypothetical protein VEB68_07990 [Croceibacterium sp.]|nr:hypothetical protein [Croceibacterium sp.]
MTLVPMILAAAAALSGDAGAAGGGAQLASARVGVEILQPVAVRQNGGFQERGDDAPKPQVTRRDGTVLIEFQ